MKPKLSVFTHPTVLACLVVSTFLPWAAQAAYPVTVIESVPIKTQVAPLLGTMSGTLTGIATTQQQVGAAINQNGGKIATQIEQAAQAQRDQDIFSRQTDRLEEARKTYTVPDSICTESSSGMATEIQSSARARQSALSGGSGISNSKVRQGVTLPSPPPEQTQFRAASIHADYCDSTDFDAIAA